MVDANIMELIDLSLRTARGNQKPFGGVKVVVFGDDNQLPPVESWSTSKENALVADLEEIEALSFNDKNREETEAKKRAVIEKANFDRERHKHMLTEYGGYRWYKSNVLGVSNPLAYMLTKNRRQEKDKKYADTLKKIPLTEVTASELAYFNESNVEVPQEILDMGIIRLVLTNERANILNKEEVDKLERSGALGIEFEGRFTGEGKSAFTKDNLHVPEKIKYYVGEKVIFVQNDTMDLRTEAGYGGKTNRWTNGTQGTVVGFDDDDGLPLVEIVADDKTKTVVKVGYGKSVAKGAVGSTQLDPLTGEISETSQIGILAEYTQIPMLPAYAMTIHKSQGRSIDRAIVDLQKADGTDAKAFAPGQLYVALSRLISKDGLYLTRKLKYQDFMVDKDNEQYYADLVKITEESLKVEAEAARQAQAPIVDKKTSGADKMFLRKPDENDLKSARDILQYKTKSIPGLPSDWGTSSLSDDPLIEFGYDYSSYSDFEKDLDAVMTKEAKDLSIAQQLLVKLILEYGKVDTYVHSESGSIIKRLVLDDPKDMSLDEHVLETIDSHKFILSKNLTIKNGFMDITLRARRVGVGEDTILGQFSSTSSKIELFTGMIEEVAAKRTEDGDPNPLPRSFHILDVLAHEYGHYLDHEVNKYFGSKSPSFASYIRDLILAGMKNRAEIILSKHALETQSEYVAESYAGYITQDIYRRRGYSEEAIFDPQIIEKLADAIDKHEMQSRNPTWKVMDISKQDVNRAREAEEAHEKDMEMMWERIENKGERHVAGNVK